MRSVILQPLSCLAIQTLTHFSITISSFKNYTVYKFCVLSYSENISIILLILKIIQENINIDVYRSFFKSTCYICLILIIAVFSGRILEYFWNQISWKPVQWQHSCFLWTQILTNRQTDITMLIVRFHIFVRIHLKELKSLFLGSTTIFKYLQLPKLRD